MSRLATREDKVNTVDLLNDFGIDIKYSDIMYDNLTLYELYQIRDAMTQRKIDRVLFLDKYLNKPIDN